MFFITLIVTAIWTLVAWFATQLVHLPTWLPIATAVLALCVSWFLLGSSGSTQWSTSRPGRRY